MAAAFQSNAFQNDAFEVGAGGVNGTATPAGVSSTASVGSATLSGTALVNATGLQVTSSIGTATASGGSSVSASATPSGVSSTASVGTTTQSGAAVKAATGVGTTASVGTSALRGDALKSVTGVSSTASVGTATATGGTVINGTATPAGVQVTASVGTAVAVGGVSVVATAYPNGVGVTTSIGGFRVNDYAPTYVGSSYVSESTLVGNARVDAVGVGATSYLGAVYAHEVITYPVSSDRANLIYELALLHGLVPGSPLSVSATSRSAGALSQTISGANTVTITTTSSDVLQGSLDTWIDALAAVHGLTAPLVVTATSRDAGALHQTLANDGTTTTVTA